MAENKNQKKLESFTVYCKTHPQERFWQALRNWSKKPFILSAKDLDLDTNNFISVEDTFYEE